MAEPAVRTRVRLCGPLMVEIDGRDTMAAVPAGQARSLLAYLLTRPDRCAERAALIEVVWPSEVPKDPQAHLRVILTRLRRALAPATLEGRPQLRLALPEPVWVDVAAATQAIEAARSDAASAAWGGALAHARAALELLRPGLLPGQEGDWAQDERREHEALELEALEWTARGGLALGGAELAGAQRAARELVSRSAFRETGQRLLMETLAATGNVAEALQVYDELRCLLRDELGVAPAAELQALHQRLLTGEPVRELASTVVRAGIAPAPTRYARNGEISLAYQVVGDGPAALLLVTGWVLPMEAIWEDPAYVRFVERLAVVVPRDPVGQARHGTVGPRRGRPAADARGAHGRHRRSARRRRRRAAAIAGMSEGAVLAALFGAAHPERTQRAGALRRLGRTVGDEDYRAHAGSRAVRRVRRRRPALMGRHGLVPRAVGADLRARSRRARVVDARASPRGEPGSAVAWLRMLADFDIRGVVGAIHTPTLVLHRAGDRIIPVENGRWLAAGIPGAEYVELAGDDHLWWLGDQDACSTSSSASSSAPGPHASRTRPGDGALHRHRRLDRRAAEVGDRRWRDCQSTPRGDRPRPARALPGAGGQDARRRVHVEVRRACARDPLCRRHPRRGASARARAASRAAHRRGRGGRPRPPRRRRGDRRACRATAASGEVIVSRTVRDLVAGSGIEFEDRGAHELKGIDDDWHLYALAAA